LVAAPLDDSLPPAPPLLMPEVEPPLGALELALSEPEGAVAPPEEAELFCLMQSSRSVPLMPAHWLGTAALSLPLGAVLGAALGVELLLGALGAADLSDELLLCAHAAPANAMATAAAITLSMNLS
jgi:hypothetical protein